ncbi:MAG: hypothetical protein A2293_05695 [Elusimicrobia bacterium RIFOXYB2_FULL_49_7]|nr:MAG: hypothetical protein A2293_05695 [Elusimicrobia bacterium RIFOXYB2_FULL_49_7]
MESGIKRIKIPPADRASLIKICNNLPYNSKIELGGYITPAAIYYRQGDANNVPISGKHRIVFHTHPNKPGADMPSELDILNLIFMDWSHSILMTPQRLIIMSKTASTVKAMAEMGQTHDKYTIDVATLLHEKGPESAFFFLARKFMALHTDQFKINHENWAHIWERFVVEQLKIELKTWDCVPISEAA